MSKMLFVKKEFENYFMAGDPFDIVARQDGELFKNKDGRRTLQFTFEGKRYFLKYHKGVGWKEIIKNLLQLRLPVLGARNEFNAINKLHTIGIDTMNVVACGVAGGNPARQVSFLVTEELGNTINIEEYIKNKRPSFRVKMTLLTRLASIARRLHENGLNHRDFYLCHFLICRGLDEKSLIGNDFSCFLIDLHRVQIRHAVPRRWQVKDLGSLFYSAKCLGYGRGDALRFMAIYFDLPVRELLARHASLVRAVETRCNALYLKSLQH